MKKVVICIALSEMPCDRWDAGLWQHVHHTGNMVVFDDGSREDEYVDDEFVYSEDCIYITEKEWLR